MPRSNFDPYAHMNPEEKARIKESPRSKHKMPKHEVRGGKVYRQGTTDPIEAPALQVNRDRHARRVVELDQAIARLQAERQQHLDQAAELDDVLAQIS